MKQFPYHGPLPHEDYPPPTILSTWATLDEAGIAANAYASHCATPFQWSPTSRAIDGSRANMACSHANGHGCQAAIQLNHSNGSMEWCVLNSTDASRQLKSHSPGPSFHWNCITPTRTSTPRRLRSALLRPARRTLRSWTRAATKTPTAAMTPFRRRSLRVSLASAEHSDTSGDLPLRKAIQQG